MRCSPTKPCGKGSKRKQDDLDEEEEAEQQSWVEALNQEIAEEDHALDPDYEVCLALQYTFPSLAVKVFIFGSFNFTPKFKYTNFLAAQRT